MLNQPLDGEVGDNDQRIGRSTSNIRSNDNQPTSVVHEDPTDGVQRATAGDETPHVIFAAGEESVSTISTERSAQQPESLGSIRLTAHDQEAINRVCR